MFLSASIHPPLWAHFFWSNNFSGYLEPLPSPAICSEWCCETSGIDQYSSYLKPVHFLASSSLGESSVWSHTAAWRMHLHFVWKTGTWYLIGRLRVGWPIFVSVMLLWEVSLSLHQTATARVGGLSTTWNDDHIAKIMANASFSITV